LFFGDPETKGTKQDAEACVRMAIAMQRRLRELEREWQDAGLQRSFHVRMAINTGYCTVAALRDFSPPNDRSGSGASN